jgi:FG-GAP-like repeat
MTATLTTLVNFGHPAPLGLEPEGDLFADSDGDLFGTTFSGGGAIGDGIAFEIEKTATGYSSTPITQASFPDPGVADNTLIADANGDLFGTTHEGGADNEGAVFEIVKTPAGNESTPTTLVSFDGTDGRAPLGRLFADADGDLFGTTIEGGANNDSTVFEIVKTPTGYDSTPKTLASFDLAALGVEGAVSGLTGDANDDLFGTTDDDTLPNGVGTIFELAKTATGYADTPKILATVAGAFGVSGVIADANGDLFGTTNTGGVYNAGTVFEIVKTPTGYDSTPKTLASFAPVDGQTFASDSLIMDANGDLFGTTHTNGENAGGAVFEIKKTATGYADLPTLVFDDFGPYADGSVDGSNPGGSLVADANGDLFGTTGLGGANGGGTLFEITGSGFVPTPPTGNNDILFQNVSGQVAIWDVSGATETSGALLGANPGPNWKDLGTGDFNDDMLPDILLQNTNGAIAIWETNGTSVTSSAVVANPGPNWRAIGTGDFNDDGHSDILLQNTSGAVAIWDMNGTSVASSAVVANPGLSWKAVGTGDFNDDGHSDILLQNTNGTVAIWEMNGANGTTIADSAVVASPGPNWKVVGTGDFNGDGDPDILLQNTSGAVAIWEMHGTNLMSSGLVSTNLGPSWHAIGTNGGSDILFQNTSGQTAIWDMSGTNITGSGAVSANAGPNWRAIGLT